MIGLKETILCLHIAARLTATALDPVPVLRSDPPSTLDRSGDAFMEGYIAALLEQELRWERESYHIRVVGGVATLTLITDDPMRRERAKARLSAIDGLRELTFGVDTSHAPQPGTLHPLSRIASIAEPFPAGDQFRPLIADPKQPQFFVSFYRFGSAGVHFTMASVGFGETFGLYRFFNNRKGNGLQLSLEGALFAQFNMNTPSSDLMNADYTIGLPATYRYGDHSIRLRLYHQSSHLGDELLQGANPPRRINLSYEAIEVIYSREWRGWRAYGGGEYLFHREPSDLKPLSAHWGVEYRGSRPILWNGRLIAGADMKKLEEHDWTIDTSVKAGIEFGQPNPGQRRMRLTVEWYKGLDPHGQFFINQVEYYGLGVSLGF